LYRVTLAAWKTLAGLGLNSVEQAFPPREEQVVRAQQDGLPVGEAASRPGELGEAGPHVGVLHVAGAALGQLVQHAPTERGYHRHRLAGSGDDIAVEFGDERVLKRGGGHARQSK
jgi:hypothetical protein